MKNPNETIRLTTAQAVVKYLQTQFTEFDGTQQRLISGIFGIFGHGNVAGLGQAIHEYGQDLTYFQPFNEQSMVHTAIGFAKAKRRRSTLACTSSIGPGSTNMITGAATATLNRIPVLLLPSDYYVTRLQGTVLQQLEHPISADVSVNDCFRPVSRFFDRITRPEQLLSSLPEAMRVLSSPSETGAVTISLPQDIQAFAYDYPTAFFRRRVWRIDRQPPVASAIADAATLLLGAQRPAVIAGGGVHYSEAYDELQTFCEQFGIPVGETSAGKGSIRTDSRLLVGGFGATGNPAAGKIFRDADVVLAVGTRLTDFTTGSLSAFQNPDVKFVSINVCGHDAFKLSALPIVGDAREALVALRSALELHGLKPNEAYLREIDSAKNEWQRCLDVEITRTTPDRELSQAQVIAAVNTAAENGDTAITAAGSPPAEILRLWDATGGRSCHIEFGNSCMGYEIPAAIGVRLAQSHGEIYAFVGDGTWLMNPTEIVTSVQEGLKITVLLIENHGYQCIRSLQLARTGYEFGNEFRTRNGTTGQLDGDFLSIDFVEMAQSMGARTWHVHTAHELTRALQEARAETRCCVIVIEVDKYRFAPGSGVWWDVATAEVSEDSKTRQLRREYEEQKAALQRTFV